MLASLAAMTVYAQQNLVLGEDTVKISDHVWAIMGVPNIGIVVGMRATLVVDTGLGPRNGATIARVAAKLSVPNAKLYLTTTHSIPNTPPGTEVFRLQPYWCAMPCSNRKWTFTVKRCWRSSATW